MSEDPRYRALYSCSAEGCREEVSFHADDLRVLPNGDLICDGCFNNIINPEEEEGVNVKRWDDLPKFTPPPSPAVRAVVEAWTHALCNMKEWMAFKRLMEALVKETRNVQ